MNQSDLTRFDQLFRIAFDVNGSLKSNCSDELKRRLIEACQRVNPNMRYGNSASRNVSMNANLIVSLHKEYFS